MSPARVACPATAILAAFLLASCAGQVASVTAVPEASSDRPLVVDLGTSWGEPAQLVLGIGDYGIRGSLPMPDGNAVTVDASRRDDGQVEVVLKVRNGIVGATSMTALRPREAPVELNLGAARIRVSVSVREELPS